MLRFPGPIFWPKEQTQENNSFFLKIHPSVICFHHCTSSSCLSSQATMTKKRSEALFCGPQQILQCSCCCWRPFWTKFMRKYNEYLLPSVTHGVTKTRICWVNLAVGPQQPLSSKQVWIRDLFTFSPKVMWLYNKGDYLDLLWFSAENDTLLQLCTYNNAKLLFCVCVSKLSSGLQGPILKRGKLIEKVIREAYQVIVKKPLGDCQGSRVRRPEIMSTVSPLGAIRALATMLQRRSRLSRVEPVQQFPIVCIQAVHGNVVPIFPPNNSVFMSHEDGFS